MKLIHIIPIFAFVILFFGGCLTTEQKKVNRRVERLNNQVDSCKGKLNAFFDALKGFKSISKSGEISREVKSLKPSDTLTINFLLQYFDSIQNISGDIYHLKPPVIFIQNALPLSLNSDSKNESSETQIQDLAWIDKQLVWKIHDLLKDDNRDNEISNPPTWETEETREKNFGLYLEMIHNLSECRYLLGVEDVLVKPSKLIDNKTFESGLMFSKIHIFDISQNKIVAQYYTLNKNSNIVFVDTLNVQRTLSDLDEDLKQEVFGQLKRRFEKK